MRITLGQRRRPVPIDGIATASMPVYLQASLDLLLGRDPAMRVQLRCQVQEIHRGDPGRGRSAARTTCSSSSTGARPTPQ